MAWNSHYHRSIGSGWQSLGVYIEILELLVEMEGLSFQYLWESIQNWNIVVRSFQDSTHIDSESLNYGHG